MNAPGSFKDPMGSVTLHTEHVTRSIMPSYRAAVDQFLDTPLFRELATEELILPAQWDTEAQAYAQPRLTQWTYPFEWSFSMLQAAALHTLEIQKRALRAGYTLKDGTAYNIAFKNLAPVHVDLYSFEKLSPRVGWTGYEQFCCEFLNPLLLENVFGVPFQTIYRAGLNGISTDVLGKLCRFPTMLHPSVFTHVTLKRWIERVRGENATRSLRVESVPAKALITMELKNIDKLSRRIAGLTSSATSAWLGYKQDRRYSDGELEMKRSFTREFLKARAGCTLVDYGCNDGEFTQEALLHCSHVTAIDSDARCIDALYRNLRARTPALTVGVTDLCNPTPRLGWELQEREAFSDRLLPSDAFLALAFIHHLRICANIPTKRILSHFAQYHRCGLLEYVAPEDPMAAQLIAARPGFDTSDYDQAAFRAALSESFRVHSEERISETRSLFLIEAA